MARPSRVEVEGGCPRGGRMFCDVETSAETLVIRMIGDENRRFGQRRLSYIASIRLYCLDRAIQKIGIDFYGCPLACGRRRVRRVPQRISMILVTGAAGLSGSIIVRNFAERQTKARALVRNRLRVPWLDVFSTIEVVEGDMRRSETLDSALQGIDRVLMISSSDPQMVETQCAFIDVCKRAGVEYVVKLSGKESSRSEERSVG